MEFSPTDRIDTRLVVLDWPFDPADPLADAVEDVAAMDPHSGRTEILADATSQHLYWRGYVTGGLIVVYERLKRPLLMDGLSALISEPRFTVFVPHEGTVAVLGVLRWAIPLTREQWDERVGSAGSTEDLLRRFGTEAMERVSEEIKRARERTEGTMFTAPPPPVMEQIAPGEVDLALLEDASTELIRNFEPDGLETDTWASCRLLRWRTDFLAPGTGIGTIPGEEFEDSHRWRVVQWKVVDEDEEENGQLVAWAPIAAVQVAELLPDRVRDWVVDETRRGLEHVRELADEEEWARKAAAVLSSELRDLDAAGTSDDT